MIRAIDSEYERIIGIIHRQMPPGWSKEDVWQTVLAECDGNYDSARLYLDRLDSDPQFMSLWVGEFRGPRREWACFALGVLTGLVIAILSIGAL